MMNSKEILPHRNWPAAYIPSELGSETGVASAAVLNRVELKSEKTASPLFRKRISTGAWKLRGASPLRCMNTPAAAASPTGLRDSCSDPQARTVATAKHVQ